MKWGYRRSCQNLQSKLKRNYFQSLPAQLSKSSVKIKEKLFPVITSAAVKFSVKLFSVINLHLNLAGRTPVMNLW